MQYQNPILPGFHPDPSICRVGDDFYLVTSSFEYFPGLPIYHSRDLVHWEQIGHCLTRDSQVHLVTGAPNCLNIYAPTIRYHDGLFYVIVTNVTGDNHGNFIITAKDPAGEWSDPIALPFPGIDPSLFFDEDGKVYYLGTDGGIYLSEMDITTGAAIGETHRLWQGTANNPEGPHLYKIDGMYYLLLAQGGTELCHMAVLARSESILGPYEPCPHNPILTNIGQSLPIKAAGHADLVEDADGNWWDSVGEWQESKKRFPNGVREVTDYIRSKGMIPGVWLELEVMGINCKKASILPDECFFLRHGKRVYDRSRYQLDFRHPLVIEHVTEVIDRVVRDYGVGYIKMDYNIEPGIGTEVDADSFGDGLLEHERAYLAWLDGIYKKYPDLVIENCSSGGLRMDYAMLARNSIQSTSDQEDYRNYATISANAAIGVTPEQAAIWSYPLRDGTKEEVIFNMVNALLLRIHQSGHLAEISPERFELVKEGIDCYKEIRSGIKDGVPFWPMGWADNEENTSQPESVCREM